ncbi:putative endo-beta-1,6-glucanase-2 [Coleophoma crateriformis]|uniref:glucan endo-1,6-beta-glucosidase n=1 Tax=Coleophoma crateriformis TaxID=565419 RepID=A0A3D8T0Z5_9HELO|nr:putative endo-beta-1,6-glucanase-2 [Coleophoma crateriformis]
MALAVSVAAFLGLASITSAWMPGNKNITASDGNDLFARTSSPQPKAYPSSDSPWGPNIGKIRGVNLGSMYVFEPWLGTPAWQAMGCGGYKSEFDCVSGLGQTKANSAFQAHWSSWITAADFDQMTSYGLNTIRIPVGYWMDESLVDLKSEHFPQGGFSSLKQLCGWASDRGLYIIIDLHGAPAAQIPTNPDTGQYAPTGGFYVDYQYNRATTFLSWLTTQIHSNAQFRNVGMLGIVNEPVRGGSQAASMCSTFYPNAYNAIRDAEQALGVHNTDALHVQLMNDLWGSGDPKAAMPSDATLLAYDDHRYLKWSPDVPVSHASYIKTSCNDDRSSSGEDPTIVGEFSLSVPDNVQWSSGWDPSTQQDFYRKWFLAQIGSYEKNAAGWIFWTWKSQLGDYRWSYQDAVAAGVIPRQLGSISTAGIC